jgi:hypothetical protein
MDQDTVELIERRLAERVEARVRERLFKFYAALGGIALAVISFFGYNLVTGLEDQARRFAESAVGPSVQAADEAAAAARDKAAEAGARLEAFAEFQKRREEALFESERQAELNQARINRIGDEIEGQLDRIGATLADTRAQVEALSARAKEVAGIGNVAELAANLAGLTAQVALLDEQLREIRARTEGEQGYETPLADAGRIETIQRAATEQAQIGALRPMMAPPGEDAFPGIAAPAPNTVYFQFTGVPREAAQAISARLVPLGFIVPGEERLATAAGLHEVRYFFPEDRPRAQGLAEALDIILRESGYRAGIELNDLTDFKGQKPRPGTLELWLEPVPGG